MAAALFVSAGRVRWWSGWVLIGLSCLTSVAAESAVTRNKGLAAERSKVGAGEKWDKAIILFVVFLGPVASWITAGLDARHGWSPAVPAWLAASGAFVAFAGGALLVWSMWTNAYFSSVVRIQKERGHTVVTDGPYRLVRHPGYAGMSAFMLVTPLILGSWWAFVPATMTVFASVVRTALEDRLLQEQLPGYSDYAGRVRHRLVPFMW